ncbi:MAG: hypothetical protein KF901_33955 [Myxococcales bacterium]|nr:hypothetical protein [Myxococcales bacterium]
MTVVLTSVHAGSADVFELERTCSLCGHRTWARVRGEGRAHAIGSRPEDLDRARYLAASAARSDAIQKLAGCACLGCGRHDPQTVAWAKPADERAARRGWWRIQWGR